MQRGLVVLGGLAVASAVVVGVVLWQTDVSGQETFEGVPASDPGPIHVHGLGVNPSDGALFIATHTGLFRTARGERTAVRVADRFQDTMGFTIAGPNRFLGSGHPDLREAQALGLPPLLGLIESNDAGKTWESVSLLGRTDFHVLRAAGSRIYGYDSTNDVFLASDDGGSHWQERTSPGRIIDLVVTAARPDRLLATAGGGAEDGLFESEDGGRSWRRTSAAVGLLALPADDVLYLISAGGALFVSSDGGRRLEPRGNVGEEPAALYARDADELYVALHDGVIRQSTDGGRTWRVRSTP